MDELLTKLGSFVASKDSRLACAAAVVITELAPRDSQLVKILTDILPDADAVRRPFIIEALGRIGTAEAAAALVPLIKSEGAASEQALRAIAHTASAALKPLLKLVGNVPPQLLERIAECAARTGESTAFSTLLSALNNADVDVCRAIRSGMRTAMSSFDNKSKEQLRKQLDQHFKDKQFVHHVPALIALMKISGDLGDTSLGHYILPRIESEYPSHVRRAALQSLAMLHFSGEQRAKLASKIIPMLLDPDTGNIAEPALEAIRHAQSHLGGEVQGHLRKLVHSNSPRIREFAMQSLAQQGTSKTIHELIACLESPDRSVREEALGALSRAPSAAAALAERLLEIEGGEAAFDTAKALGPQASKTPRKLLESLAEQYVSLAMPNKKNDTDAVRKAEEKRRAILNVFRSSNSSELVDAVYAKAEKLRREDEAQRAYELLKAVSGLNGWNDDARIEMALAGLTNSPKDLARAARSADQNLRLLEEVVSSGRRPAKDLAKQLNKDASLPRKALHYIGFHFVERMAHEREFGRLILENLAESRSDEGKQAKEKLVIEGLVAIKSGKAGILEERAKVMLAASDVIAAASAKVERSKRSASHNNGKTAKSKAKPAAPAKKAAKRR